MLFLWDIECNRRFLYEKCKIMMPFISFDIKKMKLLSLPTESERNWGGKRDALHTCYSSIFFYWAHLGWILNSLIANYIVDSCWAVIGKLVLHQKASCFLLRSETTLHFTHFFVKWIKTFRKQFLCDDFSFVFKKMFLLSKTQMHWRWSWWKLKMTTDKIGLHVCAVL